MKPRHLRRQRGEDVFHALRRDRLGLAPADWLTANVDQHIAARRVVTRGRREVPQLLGEIGLALAECGARRFVEPRVRARQPKILAELQTLLALVLQGHEAERETRLLPTCAREIR